MVLSGRRRYKFGVPIVDGSASREWFIHLTEPLRTRLTYSSHVIECDVTRLEACLWFAMELSDAVWRDYASVAALTSLIVAPLDTLVARTIVDAQLLERELFPTARGLVLVAPQDDNVALGTSPFNLG